MPPKTTQVKTIQKTPTPAAHGFSHHLWLFSSILLVQRGDKMIKEADHLMAEAIRILANLYKDGVLPKPENYAFPFPDLLTFHDAPTSIEYRLFVMFLEHRMRTFQGTFHANPDYAFWYGWSEMKQDLTEIKKMAKELRTSH